MVDVRALIRQVKAAADVDREAKRDIIKMLELQELRKPMRAESTDNEIDDDYICTNCGNDTLIYEQRYCDQCGQRLYWE